MLIVGGGIIGCAIAYFLRTPHIEITVIEFTEHNVQVIDDGFVFLSPLECSLIRL